MKKSIIITVAALGIGLAAAGCGSQAGSETTTATTAATTEATTAATTTTASTTAASTEATATTTAASTTAAAGITEAEAKEIALKAAGLAESDVTFTKVEQDIDNGIREFDIEFVKDTTEYSYEINAETGAIISQETESVND